MGKTIRRIKIISFIIILIEIVAATAFSVFYFNDLFDFQTVISPFYITLGAIAFLVINCLFVWIVILVLSSLRQKTD